MKRLVLGFLVLLGGLLSLGGVVAPSSIAASDTITFKVTSNPLATIDAADMSAVLLPNGNVRLYANSDATGQHQSWISSDGVNFTLESGNRAPAGVSTGQEQIFALPNSSYRMYFGTAQNASSQGIGSALSLDGLNFTLDPGLRITTAQAGVGASLAVDGQIPSLSSASVIQLSNGTYRMYFSTIYQNPTGAAAIAPDFIESATSTDGLTWTIDPGVRIGAGAPYITSSAEHPFAFVNSDGSVTLFFGREPSGPTDPASGLYYATSTDGLTFTSETQLLSQGEFGQIDNTPVDSSVIKLPSGQLILYSADDVQTGPNVYTSYTEVRDLTETMTLAATTTTAVATSPTTTTTLKALAPRAPSIHGSSTSKGVLSISLNAALANGGSPITRYQYSLGGKLWINISKNVHGVFVISHLSSGKTYSVRLRAKNAVGYGVASKAVKVRVR